MRESKKLNMENLKKNLIDNIVWVLLLIGVIVFIILRPAYFNPLTNFNLYLNIPMQASVMGVMTIGLAGTILLGDIDLSCVGIMAVSAATGILLYKQNHVPVVIAMLIIIAMGGFIGFINGVLIAKLKTLAMNTTLAGVVLAITRGRTITINEKAYTIVGQGKIADTIQFLVIIFILVYVLMYFVWNRTPLGRSLFAVGGNPECARVSGINVDRIRIAAFTISGVMAGLAGLMLSSKMGSINSVFGSSYSMDIIAAAVIGGTSLSGGIGKVSGVLGGVLLLNFVQVGLQVFGMDSYYVQAATGLIILLAVLIDSFRIRLANKE